MRMRTTLLLFLAVLLAGVALWYLELRTEWEDGRRPDMSRLFPSHPDRVVQLAFDAGDLRVDCRKADGVWRLVQPVQARADAGEMDRMLTVLSALRAREVITPRERRELDMSLRDFGLERPHARIEWEDDLRRHVILVGRVTPLGDAVYAMREGDDEVVTMPAELLQLIPESAEALRDRILFHGDPRRAYRVEIRRAGAFLQLVRGDDGSWRVQQPIAAPADRGTVRQLIDRLFEWRITDFVADTMADAVVYGLDDDATQVSVWTEGQEASQSVLLGSLRNRQGEFVYARRRDGQSVFTVPAQALTDARVRANDVRNRALLPLLPQDIGGVRISLGDETVVLRRDAAGTWELKEPRRWRADDELMAALIETWTSTRIARFVDDAGTNLHALGFTDDALRISFELRAGVAGRAQSPALQEPVTVWISTAPATEGQLLVTRVDEPFVYEIPNAVQQVTSWNPMYYRHREVVRINPASVMRIRQVWDGIEQVAERNGAGVFGAAPIRSGEISTSVITNVLAALTRLQAEEYVIDDPRDWSQYGLDEPRVVWSLGMTGEDGLGLVLMLGDALADGRAYGRTLGQDMVFLLSAEHAALLSQRLFVVREHSTPLSPGTAEDDE